MSRISASLAVLSKYLEILLFPESAKGYFHWTHSLLAIVGLIIACVLNGIYNVRVYIPILKKSNVLWIWNFVWVVPLTFNFVWTTYQTISPNYRNGTMETPIVLLLIILVNIGSYFTYYMLIKLVDSEDEKMRLTYMENIQQSQYQNLQLRINDARRARHDLRHHLRMLDAMAKEGDLDKLRDYLDEYRLTIPDDHNLTFCEHYPINAMLVYFDQQCKEAGIPFTATVSFPAEINISTSDLSIVFGNLLENALTACKRVYSKPAKATLVGKLDGSMLYFQLRNTTEEYPRMNEQGVFYSTTHNGLGIGTQSVRSIVEKYNGSVNYEEVDGDFQATVIMMLPDAASANA